MVKIPLSIPKNVVLISLMEAAQRQVLEASKEEKQKQQQQDKLSSGNRDRKGNASTSNGDQDGDSDDDDDDDSSAGSVSDSDEEGEDDNEEFNLDRIISGMATLSGSCGTYAVTVDGQVVVQPNDPRHGAATASTSSSSSSSKACAAQHSRGGPTTTTTTTTTADPTSEEKKTDEIDVAAAAVEVSPTGVKDVHVPTKLQLPQLGAANDDETAVCSSSQDGLPPLSPIQSAGSYASRDDDDDDDDDDCEHDDVCDPHRARSGGAVPNTREPFVLRKGQTVQVVSLEDGVAKLARNAGYIVLGSTSHLVKGTHERTTETTVLG
jgi:hypothetical protein